MPPLISIKCFLNCSFCFLSYFLHSAAIKHVAFLGYRKKQWKVLLDSIGKSFHDLAFPASAHLVSRVQEHTCLDSPTPEKPRRPATSGKQLSSSWVAYWRQDSTSLESQSHSILSDLHPRISLYSIHPPGHTMLVGARGCWLHVIRMGMKRGQLP